MEHTLFNGYLADEEGVAEILEDLYNDHDKRKSMGRAAFHNATRETFGWDSIAARWMTVFEDLMARA